MNFIHFQVWPQIQIPLKRFEKTLLFVFFLRHFSHFFPIDLVLCATYSKNQMQFPCFCCFKIIGLRCYHWHGRLIWQMAFAKVFYFLRSLFRVFFSLFNHILFHLLQMWTCINGACLNLIIFILFSYDLKRAKRFGIAKKLKRIAFNSTFVSIALPSIFPTFIHSIFLSLFPLILYLYNDFLIIFIQRHKIRPKKKSACFFRYHSHYKYFLCAIWVNFISRVFSMCILFGFPLKAYNLHWHTYKGGRKRHKNIWYNNENYSYNNFLKYTINKLDTILNRFVYSTIEYNVIADGIEKIQSFVNIPYSRHLPLFTKQKKVNKRCQIAYRPKIFFSLLFFFIFYIFALGIFVH